MYQIHVPSYVKISPEEDKRKQEKFLRRVDVIMVEATSKHRKRLKVNKVGETKY